MLVNQLETCTMKGARVMFSRAADMRDRRISLEMELVFGLIEFAASQGEFIVRTSVALARDHDFEPLRSLGYTVTKLQSSPSDPVEWLISWENVPIEK